MVASRQDRVEKCPRHSGMAFLPAMLAVTVLGAQAPLLDREAAIARHMQKCREDGAAIEPAAEYELRTALDMPIRKKRGR